jgi:hypothetical protein
MSSETIEPPSEDEELQTFKDDESDKLSLELFKVGLLDVWWVTTGNVS